MLDDPTTRHAKPPPVGGEALAGHLFEWLNREAPEFLSHLQGSFGAASAREAFVAYLRMGDEGLHAWGDHNYYARAGRALPGDMIGLLRRYFAELGAGVAKLRCLDSGEALTALQVQSLLPDEHLAFDDVFNALRRLLPDIYRGELEVSETKRRVRVFGRRDQGASAVREPRSPAYRLLRKKMLAWLDQEGAPDPAARDGHLAEFEKFVTAEAARRDIHPSDPTIRRYCLAAIDVFKKTPRS